MIVARPAQLLLCCVLTLGAAPALAASSAADCPPLEPPEGYIAVGPPDRYAQDVVFFPVETRNSARHERVAGATCRQNYRPETPQAQRSDSDVQDIFQRQIMRAGADLLFTDDGLTSARLEEDTSETWMMIYSEELLIQVTVVRRTR